MSEDALTEDPETGVPVTKVLHAPSIHFKGSGFYNTDYGKQTKSASQGRQLASTPEQRRLEVVGEEDRVEVGLQVGVEGPESKGSSDSKTRSPTSRS